MKIKSEIPKSEIRNPKPALPRADRFSSFVIGHPPFQRGFSLLEAMIAIGILCVGTFAILALISSSLANARRLQRPLVDAGNVLAFYVGTTNKFDEGTYSANLSEILGKSYHEYKYTFNVGPPVNDPEGTNDLLQLDAVIQYANGGNHDVLSQATTLYFEPGHSARKPGGGLMHR
jgi:prepilin-type N-terminal cleavage/methylation domain-containing protein